MTWCCPKWKLVLILSAIHRITITGWHEIDVSIPQKTIAGPHDWCVSELHLCAFLCLHECEVPITSCPVAVPVNLDPRLSGHAVLQAHMKMKARWAPQQSLQTTQASSEERSHFPQQSRYPAAGVCAPTRPPLPPPLPLPNPSWISMRNFRDLAVWGMPDLHRYQTYESCRSNLCWSLLTFDWRTSSDLNTLTNAKSASTVLATLPLRHLSIEMVLGF